MKDYNQLLEKLRVILQSETKESFENFILSQRDMRIKFDPTQDVQLKAKAIFKGNKFKFPNSISHPDFRIEEGKEMEIYLVNYKIKDKQFGIMFNKNNINYYPYSMNKFKKEWHLIKESIKSEMSFEDWIKYSLNLSNKHFFGGNQLPPEFILGDLHGSLTDSSVFAKTANLMKDYPMNKITKFIPCFNNIENYEKEIQVNCNFIPLHSNKYICLIDKGTNTLLGKALLKRYSNGKTKLSRFGLDSTLDPRVIDAFKSQLKEENLEINLEKREIGGEYNISLLVNNPKKDTPLRKLRGKVKAIVKETNLNPALTKAYSRHRFTRLRLYFEDIFYGFATYDRDIKVLKDFEMKEGLSEGFYSRFENSIQNSHSIIKLTYKAGFYCYNYQFIEPKRPPLGLKPRWLHEEQRIIEIEEAFSRYLEAKTEPPIEWTEEILELRLNKQLRNLKKKK